MKKNLLLTLALFIMGAAYQSFAQKQGQAVLDSLLTVLKTAHEDSSKVKTLLDVGTQNSFLGKYVEGKKYSDEALTLSEKLGFKNGISQSYTAYAYFYSYLGDYPKALEYYQKSLKIKEQLNNKLGVAENLADLGALYKLLFDFPKALEYDQKALTIAEEVGNKLVIARVLLNIGAVYGDLSKDSLALEYYQKALKPYKELNQQRVIGIIYHDIGLMYQKNKNYTEALKYHKAALEIRERLGLKWGISLSNISIGDIYFNQGNYPAALKSETKGLSIAMEIGKKDCMLMAYECLTRIDSAMNNFRGAFEYHKRFKEINDSLFNMEKDKKLTTLALNYDFAKVQDSTHAAQVQKDLIAMKELQKQKLVRNGFVGGFAVVLLFAGVFFRQRNKISKEKKRSDELLLNILPSEVAEELKAKGRADAKQFDDVTVMFTDFKNFTQISENLSPTELVNEIHTCFKAFDGIISKHNIEKIKTIGDSYMCAGGLPVTNTTNATDVVKAAMEIQQFMQEHLQQRKNEGKEVFEIRIGIHTGPVVAGIVGVKKFAYDIWGDTVNIASRMESSGEAGKVNISGSTFNLVKDKFSCIHRGKIQAKNKGEIDMYFVETVS